MKTIKSACGYRQTKKKKDLVGKVIKDIILKDDEMFQIFSDNTYAYFEVSYFGNYNPSLELVTEEVGYEALFEWVNTEEGPEFELTSLGRILGADLKKLEKIWKKDREKGMRTE